MSRFLIVLLVVALAPMAWTAELPPAATRPVDFQKEIVPLFQETCVKCHAKGREKGGFSLETRASFLKGGDTGEAAKVGDSKKSLVVEMVAGVDPDEVMPKKGTRWTAEQVGLLRAWIDQGAVWPENISFARPAPRNLEPRTVQVPEGALARPVDVLLEKYFSAHGGAPGSEGVPPSRIHDGGTARPAPTDRPLSRTPPPRPSLLGVDDRVFARRAYLDAIGLLPTPEQLDAFLAHPDRAALVKTLLADQRGYADHWLSFWNDLLRNDYKGVGFIDGGRKQISEWLYDALLANKPYNQFVSELMNPDDKALGFTAGIIWRGTVAAAMTPPMQAAQSVSQVFLGINLKCASCHDSFVSDWTLADAYGMAAVFSDNPLELVRCDKPTGQKAALRFLYPQVGGLDPAAPRAERMQRFASLMTAPNNGRLSRTIVNRLWARLLGRGLVEPLDDMDRAAWSPDLLDWLASDFEAHGYDLKHTIETIMTSAAYRLPTVEPPAAKEEYVFRGPFVRRLSAEQFADAVSTLTGEWARLPSTLEFDLSGGGVAGNFTMPKWIWTPEPNELGAERMAWKYAADKANAAQAAVATARQKVESLAPDAVKAMQAAAVATQASDEMAKWAAGQFDVRHKIVFRKTFPLAAKPERAYAVFLASQGFEVAVNGSVIKPKMIDGFRSGRSRLFDLTKALQAGENVIAINVESHTDKSLTDTERPHYPGATQHLNKTPGLAAYVCAEAGGQRQEILSDTTWKARRSQEGGWASTALVDRDWRAASLLPEGVTPVDDGPGLEPIRREDFANIPVQLGPALRAACSTAELGGRVRAAMLAADPLQVALDRPNREIVITSRANSATTIQALELTNGATLSAKIDRAGPGLLRAGESTAQCVDRLYLTAFGRSPSETERAIALEMVGQPATGAGASDLLWSLTMLPEFQFIR